MDPAAPAPAPGNPGGKNLSTVIGHDTRGRQARFRAGHGLEQGSVIEHSGQVRHPQQGDRARGLAQLDGATRASLARRRWQQPPLTRPALTLTLVLVVLLHALFALALWYAMQPRLASPAAPLPRDQALLVRLIELPGEPHAAPPHEPPAPPTPPRATNERVRPTTHEAPRRDALAMQDHAPAPAPAASAATPPASGLFAKDGSVRLPPTQATYADPGAKAKPAEPAEPPDDRRIMQHDSNRMQYKATRFEKYFPPPNETAGGAVGRHIGDALKKITANMCDPKKASTVSNLLCGAPPLPPSPKDRDERLNLPPPPLAGGDPHPARPLPLATCFALYKADKPLPYGCPINTPDLAFQAQMRECIDLFRAGKRLKTWCPADTPRRAAAASATPSPAVSAGSP